MDFNLKSKNESKQRPSKVRVILGSLNECEGIQGVKENLQRVEQVIRTDRGERRTRRFRSRTQGLFQAAAAAAVNLLPLASSSSLDCPRLIQVQSEKAKASVDRFIRRINLFGLSVETSWTKLF